MYVHWAVKMCVRVNALHPRQYRCVTASDSRSYTIKGKPPPVIVYEAGWDPRAVLKRGKDEKNLDPDLRALQIVTIITQVPRPIMCERFTPTVHITYICRYMSAVPITVFYFGCEAKYHSLEDEIITAVLRKCLVGLGGLG